MGREFGLGVDRIDYFWVLGSFLEWERGLLLGWKNLIYPGYKI